MMEWQMYWPNWWKIYPVWKKECVEEMFNMYHNVLSIGPFQAMWWSQK